MRLFSIIAIAFLLIFTSTAVPQSKDSESGVKPPEKIADRSLAEWVKELKHSDPAVRVSAVQTVGMFGERAGVAVPILIERLSRERDISLRANISLALSAIHVRESDVPEVVKALAGRLAPTEDQAIVRYYAAGALGRFEEKAVPALRAVLGASRDPRSWEIRRAAVSTLGRMAKKANKEIFEAILNGLITSLRTDHCAQVRLSATLALTDVGKKGTEEQKQNVLDNFRKHLNDPDVTVAVWAHVGVILVDKVSPDYLNDLAKFLKSEELTARTHAIHAMAVLGKDAEPRVQDLVRLVQNDPEPLAVGMASWALGEIGLKVKLDKKIAGILRAKINDSEIDINARQEMVAAVKKILFQKKPDKEEKATLEKMWKEHLKNLKPDVNKQIVKLGGKKLDQWKKEIRDKDPSVRENATRTLPFFGADSRDGVENLIYVLTKDKDVSMRVNVARAFDMVEIANRDVPDVVDILKRRLRFDKQAIVRYYAARTLGRFLEEARVAIPELLLATRDGASWEIRQVAIQSLAQVARDTKNGPEARVVSGLIRALSDRCASVRLTATAALGALGAAPNSPEGLVIIRALQRVKDRDANRRVAIWGHVGLMAMDKVTDERLASLTKFLKFRDHRTRMNAARAFGVLGKHAFPHVKDLVEALEDPAPLVVGAACWALGEIGKDKNPGPEAVKKITTIAEDKEKPEGLREVAKEALKKIRGEKTERKR